MKHGGEPPSLDDNAWLDLSTGISPLPYPLPPIAPEAWQSLPKAKNLHGLMDAARSCYAVPDGIDILAAPGTEALIFALPRITDQPAHIISPTYSSHAAAWTGRGSSLPRREDWRSGVTVLVNPNNPTGELLTPEEIRQKVDDLATSDLLVLDEAFMDVTPEQSFIPHLRPDDPVIVLRSFGKFFGLAGLRLGFAVGAPDLIAKLEYHFGDWSVSGPALAVGTAALKDTDWQHTHRAYLVSRANALRWFTQVSQLPIIGETHLFALIQHPEASDIHQRLARANIWTRIFDDQPDWIRFGMTRTDTDMARLYEAIRKSA